MQQALDAYSRTAAQNARDTRVIETLWLVKHLVGKMAARLPPGVDVENLEAAGMLGLVEAADRFNPARGVEFKAFAAIRVRGAIVDELRRSCPLPQVVLQNVTLVMRARDQLTPPASIDDLMAATGLERDVVLDCLAAIPLTQMKSLDQVGDELFAGQFEPPDILAEREECKRILADGIEALPRRERLVITLYYLEDLRLKEIGQVLKLSESRVSRLLSGAQFQLREYVRARLSEDK